MGSSPFLGDCGKESTDEGVAQPDGRRLGNVKVEAGQATNRAAHPAFQSRDELHGLGTPGPAPDEFDVLVGVLPRE